MSNLKKYAKYILLIVGGYILTSFLIFVGFNANYKPITVQGSVPEQMSIAKAEATKKEGRIYGYVTNKKEHNINGKYIVATIYNSENEEIAKEALKIEGVEYNSQKMFKVFFNAEDAKYYKIEILDENDI